MKQPDDNWVHWLISVIEDIIMLALLAVGMVIITVLYDLLSRAIL